jgi:hypothetical protein
MKSKQLFILFVAIGGSALWGCSNHSHATAEESLVLNDGKKWVVDDAMLTHIRNMEQDIAAFSGNQVADYHALAGSLQDNLNALTAGCTMTGLAHDELHKWLLPHMELVKNLSKADSPKNAEKYLGDIKRSMETFNQYFF